VSALGTPRAHFRRIDSTNAHARTLAAAGAPHGTLVTADEQTAGRGRQGRTWSAPAGRALLMSVLLREPPELLSLRAGVAACDAVRATGAAGARVKWPNDVVIGGDLAKCAGILVEGRPQEGWAVVGIGVNVAVAPGDLPPDVARRAAGLGLRPADIETVLAGLLAALEARLSQPPEALLDDWRALDALRGREVGWAGGAGVADGIDAEGRLLVVTGDGTRTALDAGEVHLGVDGRDKRRG
jgi:BirA family biotin operon repressor/biotin-[acetyl-CoA-carboxylase] ligase